MGPQELHFCCRQRTLRMTQRFLFLSRLNPPLSAIAPQSTHVKFAGYGALPLNPIQTKYYISTTAIATAEMDLSSISSKVYIYMCVCVLQGVLPSFIADTGLLRQTGSAKVSLPGRRSSIGSPRRPAQLRSRRQSNRNPVDGLSRSLSHSFHLVP